MECILYSDFRSGGGMTKLKTETQRVLSVLICYIHIAQVEMIQSHVQHKEVHNISKLKAKRLVLAC